MAGKKTKASKGKNGYNFISHRTATTIDRVAKMAYKTAKKVAYMINSEQHHYDQVVNGAVPSAGIIYNVSNIPVSATTDYGTRSETQQQVLLNSVDCRETIAGNAVVVAGANASINVRVILFTDKQQVANIAPAVLDVLETGDVYSFLNRSNLGRFQIFRDELHQFSAAGNNTYFKERHREMRKNFHTRWNESNQPEKNHIYVLLISDVNAQAGYKLQFRLNYHQN